MSLVIQFHLSPERSYNAITVHFQLTGYVEKLINEATAFSPQSTDDTVACENTGVYCWMEGNTPKSTKGKVICIAE